MSLNLYLEVNGESVNLRQTPTYVTKMCLMTSAGPADELVGPAADRALHCYMAWVMSSADGSYRSRYEADRAREEVEEECKRIRKYLGKRNVRAYLQ